MEEDNIGYEPSHTAHKVLLYSFLAAAFGVGLIIGITIGVWLS